MHAVKFLVTLTIIGSEVNPLQSRDNPQIYTEFKLF